MKNIPAYVGPMRIQVLLTALVLLPAAWAMGSSDSVEACDLDVSPVHAVDDGHAHYHHLAPAGAHAHGGEMLPSDHVHGAMHGGHGGHEGGHADPCDQTGVMRMFPDIGGIPKLSLNDAVIGTEPSVIVRDEGYAMDPQKAQTLLLLQSDAALAASGFPGSGTMADPYIIEGYAISERLTLKDTDACVVVRNNVIDGSFIEGPLVNPADILRTLDDVIEARDALMAARDAVEQAASARALTLDDVRMAQADLQAWRDARTSYVDAVVEARESLDVWKEGRQPYLDDVASARADFNAWKDGRVPYVDALVAARDALSVNSLALSANQDERLSLRADAEAIHQEMAAQKDVPALPENLNAFLDDVRASDDGTLSDLLDQLQGVADQMDLNKAERIDLRDERQGLVVDRDQAKADLGAYDLPRTDLVAAVKDAVAARIQYDDGRDPLVAALNAARLDLGAHDAEKDALVAALEQARAIDGISLDALNAARAERNLAREALNAARAVAAQGELMWLGTVYKDLDAIVQAALEAAKRAVTEDAQLVLDWNGPCVHAYHNVVDDLRVNQNNARLGFATGGVIEDNRIFDVGQLRHYDGIFRDNEIGDLAHWQGFLDGNSPASSRAANVDGFNQGQLLNNVFYGSVDLDFHGHHHGTGFFSPHSHYHGNDLTRLHDDEGMLMHDHRFRWTSVMFADNIVIDPAGQGLRYEDQNHAGDDRQANSENVEQLNEAHMHRSLIELQQNTIVGSLQVDVFNADGIQIWSDTLTPVRFDALGRVLDAVLHVGADIINTHSGRNDGWLNIVDNRVLDPSGGMGAFQVSEAKEFALDFIGNEAVSIGHGGAPGDISLGDLETVDLQSLDWGGEQHETDTGLLFMRMKDGEATICNNALYGFDSGFLATQRIMEDVAIRTCSDNTFSGDPYTSVRFTAYPKGEASLTDPVREVLEASLGDAPGHAVEPVLDAADQAGAIAG